jgi:hypothetical protein
MYFIGQVSLRPYPWPIKSYPSRSVRLTTTNSREIRKSPPPAIKAATRAHFSSSVRGRTSSVTYLVWEETHRRLYPDRFSSQDFVRRLVGDLSGFPRSPGFVARRFDDNLPWLSFEPSGFTRRFAGESLLFLEVREPPRPTANELWTRYNYPKAGCVQPDPIVLG